MWERLTADKRRLAFVIGAVALVALLIGGLLLAAQGSHEGGYDGLPPGSDGATGTTDDTPTPGGEISTPTLVPDDDTPGTDGGPAPGTNSDGTPDPAADPDATADDPPATSVTPRIAYRFEFAVWVSAEDGSGAMRVAGPTAGQYALSPDGARLAWVDRSTGILTVTGIGEADPREVAPAHDLEPVWSPDADSVVYTAVDASGLALYRVKLADEGPGEPLGAGHSPSVSPDGATVALIVSASPGQPGPIVVAGPGANQRRTLPISSATSVIWGGDGFIYVAAGSLPGQDRVMTCTIDGSRPRELAGPVAGEKPASIGRLKLSPDGVWLLYAASGDDGYSRAYTLRLSDRTRTSLSARRDTYPLAWSADGSRVFIIEGNEWQGESTALVSVKSDGTEWTVLVPGAGL